MRVTRCVCASLVALVSYGNCWGGQQPSEPVTIADRQHCGVNVVFALLRISGIEVEYQAVLNGVPIGDRGSSLESMQAFAQDHGLECDIVRATPDQLAAIPLPFIAHFDYGGQAGHYVLIVENRMGRWVFIDGASGLEYSMYPGDLVNRFSGVLLVPRESMELQRRRRASWMWYESASLVLLTCAFGLFVYSFFAKRRDGEE